MHKAVKRIILIVYCAIFIYCIKYLLYDRKEKILELNYVVKTPGSLRKIMKDIKKNRANTTLCTLDFKRPKRFPRDLKFILKWNDASFHPRSLVSNGQKLFLEQNCTHYNCYLTKDKSLLLDLRYFDAVLFDVDCDWDEHPPMRSPDQVFIFSATEAATEYPVCNANYDNYYNISWTYKLDSDVTQSLITIFDKNEVKIGPRANMTWISSMLPISQSVKRKIITKRKAAAWFLSDCNSKNSNALLILIQELNNLLTKFNLSVDVYGWCGKIKMACPRDRIEECLLLLRKDYFFYFAFEYSMSEDYISHEILYPLMNYAVPVTYGGANYSRFLPPGSYIDATKLDPNKVVSLMVEAINNPEIYHQYFRWHNHYTYKESPQDNFCDLCKILNEPNRNQSVIRNFRQWWSPTYKDLC